MPGIKKIDPAARSGELGTLREGYGSRYRPVPVPRGADDGREAEGARPAVESACEEYLKKWRLGGIVRDPEGGQSLEYIVQFKKSAEPDDLMNELRSQQHVLSVEVK